MATLVEEEAKPKKSVHSEHGEKKGNKSKKNNHYHLITETNGFGKTHKKAKPSDIFSGDWTTIYDENINEDATHLRNLAIDIFMHFGEHKVKRDVISNIIDYIQPKYHDNHYHCFKHACHVLSNTGSILTYFPNVFSILEKLALLLSALVHDVEHLGISNQALMKRKHNLSKQYNDQSIAEMYSLSIGLQLIEESGEKYALLEAFSEEEKMKFRHFFIEILLCTDVADFYKKQVLYLRLHDYSDPITGKLDISHEEGKLALLMLLMRIADVGSSMQSLRTAHTWVRHYFLETKLASLNGDGVLFDAESFFDSQVKYIQGHSCLLIEKLQKIQLTGPLSPVTTAAATIAAVPTTAAAVAAAVAAATAGEDNNNNNNNNNNSSSSSIGNRGTRSSNGSLLAMKNGMVGQQQKQQRQQSSSMSEDERRYLALVTELLKNSAENLRDWLEHGREMIASWENEEEVRSRTTSLRK